LTGKSPLSQAQFEFCASVRNYSQSRIDEAGRVRFHCGCSGTWIRKAKLRQADLVCSRIYKSTISAPVSRSPRGSLSAALTFFEGSDRVVESR